MLFSIASQQSTNYQSATAIARIVGDQMLEVQHINLNGADDRGLRGELDGITISCSALGEPTRDGNATPSSMDRSGVANHARRSNGYLINNNPESLAYRFGQLVQIVEEPERKTNESVTNRAAEIGLIPTTGSITATESRCSENRIKTWHLVPFIHNKNRLTCRWQAPSI